MVWPRSHSRLVVRPSSDRWAPSWKSPGSPESVNTIRGSSSRDKPEIHSAGALRRPAGSRLAALRRSLPRSLWDRRCPRTEIPRLAACFASAEFQPANHLQPEFSSTCLRLPIGVPRRNCNSAATRRAKFSSCEHLDNSLWRLLLRAFSSLLNPRRPDDENPPAYQLETLSHRPAF